MEKQRVINYDMESIKSLSKIKDTQCEEQVLGAMIQNEYSHNEAREIVSADCFTGPANQNIYSALEAIDLFRGYGTWD